MIQVIETMTEINDLLRDSCVQDVCVRNVCLQNVCDQCLFGEWLCGFNILLMMGSLITHNKVSFSAPDFKIRNRRTAYFQLWIFSTVNVVTAQKWVLTQFLHNLANSAQISVFELF